MMANMPSLLRIWIMLCGLTTEVVAQSIQLDFRANPSVVQPLVTENVTLQCFVTQQTQYYYNHGNSYYHNNLGPSLQSISDRKNLAMIRILKNFQDKWKPIAQISNVAPSIVHKLDASIDNTAGIISDDLTLRSYVQVSWNTATSDAYGTYRCDSVSFDFQQTAVLTTSSTLVLGDTLNALNILTLLKHDKTVIIDKINQQTEEQRLNQNLTEQLKNDVLTLDEETSSKQNELEEKVKDFGQLLKSRFEKLELRINDMESEMTERINEIGLKANLVLKSGFLMLWPRGSYGLLQPESGCPSGGITEWQSGWKQHHTESTDRNKDTLSAEIHLMQPILERAGGNNFVTQHFCTKTDTSTVGPDWPSGSYCINKKGYCPDMFQEGYIKWDEENDVILQNCNGELPDGVFNETEGTTIEYCCRQDGPADVPIYLPTSNLFYLYRYGGKCQLVHGMNVTGEFVLFDTENTNNRDEFGDVHPDGGIADIRLELCYYRS